MGIDTWAVDYVLLDKDNHQLTDAYSFRDKSYQRGVKKVHEVLSKELLYKKTGIQFQSFNTIYQLKSHDESIFEKANDFMMILDFLNYLLTGKKVNEYTNMSLQRIINVILNHSKRCMVHLISKLPIQRLKYLKMNGRNIQEQLMYGFAITHI